MAEALHHAVSKIGSTLAEEATKAVINKLSEKVNNLKELPGKVEEIEKELKMMNNVIKQISTPNLTNELVKDWIAEVREVAHRVEDVMDKYSYHALKLEEENRVKKFFSKVHYVKVFSEIADEIIQIERKIENVVKRRDRWLQLPQLIPNPLANIERKRPQDCLLEVPQDDLVGIEDYRRQLTEWLYSDEQGSTMITVSGMGGLGKTTLVTNVYEREKINFTAHAWIVVSQGYDVVELLRKMLRKIGYPEQSQLVDLDAHELKVKIKERLTDSKCLLVLDDVWNREAYTQIGDAFQNLQASRVIITTRQEQVATLAQPTRQLKLKPLERNDAFDLFCRKAFYNRMECKCPQDLEKLANNIVDRCQGLPLAIVSIGGMLSSLPPVDYVWNETYKQLRGELANNDHVRAILNLSYHDIPGDLRNCFLYCGLFPEDHQLSRESLVRLWVAEGFAVRKETSTAEEVADGYLRELIQRNMLEVVESDELGRVSTCKMHDIVRDLVLSIAKEEKFGSANDFASMSHMDKEVRRLSSCGWKDKTAVKVKFSHLRTLVALGITASSPQLLSPILSESNYLTVLELQDSEISEVPVSIGNLFNLRYIGLRRTKVKSLPESIGKLSNLHTLDIKQTKIEKLPRGIVRIKKLQHLLADRYEDEKQSEFRYFIGVQAPKKLSNLEELQTLETVQASKDLAEQLMKLTQLRSVWIDNISAADCANLFATLSKMPLLSSLLLSASNENEALCLEALRPESENLHRLIIRGCWADKTLECPIFCNHGRNLKYLAISWCRLQEDPLQLLAPLVPNLTHLRLNRVNSASTLVLSAGCFSLLKTLVLKRMYDVDQMEIRDGALPQIEGLYVVTLPKLDKVPQGIESLSSLRKLWLRGLNQDFRAQWDRNGMQQKMQYVPELHI
ncbi:disease resistance protein RPM1-like [Phragmites australis]|uniref:disease resistance protein RPM1-like n=1 Tax=Phragmites australis TaxID=29695 RepID=UPI002D779EE1|nr:disease resistance protein RPM1-like [Phragmites australis]XP_062182629.1 disease resistance protein RPM1-like [Phragmites australis]XP_062182630.1 disease resistance protein RPM1-like [Phragmites australis]XP_062182631.1 disease resistance protein RPM1-like [Phragmites australis]XP_062182633.1 disease resistance protein RPM1-like [Phragmites australis]